jgi:hypothetical protein
MSSERQQWIEQAKSNADAMEQEIESLSSSHWNLFERQYREFWAHAKEISGMFKTLKPLLKEDRERLWARFSHICEETKRKQEQVRETRRIQSRQKRELIEGKIKEAYYWAKGARDTDSLSKAKLLLNEALEWLKNGWGGFNLATELVETTLGNEGRLLRKDRDACWEKWREANEAIHWRRQEMWDSNYHQLRSEAGDALNTAHHGDPHDALAKVKEIQRNLKATQMSKPQRQEIRGLLNDAWERAISKINKIREEKRRTHEEWLSRMEDHVERWTDLIEKNEGLISGLEDQIDRLEVEARYARSNEYADRVRSWIEEKYQMIRDIRETNRESEEKIRSVKSRMNR